MANVLALPFRLSPAGTAVTVEQGAEDYYRQQLVALIMTLKGERPLSIDLGMPDMAFQGFAYSAFYSQVTTYLPEVSVLSVDSVDESDMTQTVVVAFDTATEQKP